ncbi:MAG: PD-(D/E)XK nuclease family protein [Myxococcales bacterium]|nr:PD-(D/E)XK nuclease family protein [Myxococcales bacterium]
MSSGRRETTSSEPFVLVPTERHVERARAEGVVSRRRFFGRLAAELHPEVTPATGALVRLACRAALGAASTSPALSRLFDASSAERTALVSALDATIGALREAGATPGDLGQTRTTRGAELGELLASVDDKLASLRRADERALLAPADVERAWSVGDRGPVIVEGTAHLGGALLDLLLAIHRGHLNAQGLGVRVRLPRFDDPEHPMSLLAASLERRLASEPDALEIEWLDPPEQTCHVVEAHSPAAEARAAVARVLAALDDGAAPEAIAICVPPGDEAILSPLRAALAEARVPFSEDTGRPATSIPEVRAALSLLNMASRTITRDGLVELLRLPGLHAGAFVGAPGEVEAAGQAARLAHELRQISIVRDTTGDGFVEALRAAKQDHQLDWAADATARLCHAITSLRDRGGLAPVARAWLDLISRMRLGDPSAREIAYALRSSSTSPLAALGEGAVGLRLLRRVTEELVAAGEALGGEGLDRFSTEDLLSEVERAALGARTTAPGASARAGAVRVGRPREIAGSDNDLVVVTRLATGGYRPSRGSLLLDEATRRALPPSRRPPSYAERALAAEAELEWVVRSAGRVVLTYATHDADGREAEPAHASVGRHLAAGATRSVEPASRLSLAASILSPRGRELVELANGAPPASDLVSRVAIERSRLQFFLDPRSAPGPHSGRVEPSETDDLRRRFGGSSPDNAVTVVAIEAAAACPFKAFAGRALMARQLEEVSDPLGPRERGDLVHRALFAAYEADAALPPSADRATRLREARQAAERAVELDKPSGPLRFEGKRRIVEEVVELLADELEHGSDLRYRYGERRFGLGEAEPWGALAIPHERAADPVWVEGRIDRVDLSPDGRRARVVDYKTAKTLPSMKALGESAFQLPLYARVVARQRPAELTVAYVSAAAILAGQRKRDAATPLPTEALDNAAERAAAVVRSVWSGRVPPRPAHPSACRKCAARDLCRKPAVVPASDDDDGAGA